ncbi:MAG: TonB-dependent receptor plug domain-containing protein [Acidobacteriota bacterium]
MNHLTAGNWPARPWTSYAWHRSLFKLVLMSSTFVIAISSAVAQTAPTTSMPTQPSIVGRVVTVNDISVASVSVRLRGLTVGVVQTVQADANGEFRFDQLTPGDYEITVTGDQYQAMTKTIKVSGSESTLVTVPVDILPLAENLVVTINSIVGTSESLNRIPGTVDILDEHTLQNSRAFNFNEALRKLPGIHVRDEEGFGLRPNIGIRGLNPTRSTKVLLLEDGLPLAFAPYGDNASYYHPPVERFETIEVVKGSGQILYGPVTIGGVINYLTPNPPDTPSGSLLVVSGNRDYFNGHLTYGWKLGNTGFLLDFLRKQGEGARDNVRSGVYDFNFKSVSTFGTRQVLTLKANYYDENSRVTYSGLRLDEFQANPRQNPFRNDATDFRRFGAAATHSFVINPSLLLTTSLYGSTFDRAWWRQSSNSAQRPNRRGIGGCRGMDDLFTTCGNEGRVRSYDTFGVTPQLRASFSLGRVQNELDTGFRYHWENQERQQINGSTPMARTGVTVENNFRGNDAFSGYIQNRLILGNLTVTPGVRVERISFVRANRLANSGLGARGEVVLTQIVPGIGVAYNLKQRATLFAGIHRGFAPPRTEDIISNTGGVVDLDPELSWNTEVGIRSVPVQGIRLDASYFRMNFSNQIIPASLAGGVGATLTNGGKTFHQGLELSGRVDSGVLLKSTHNVFARVNYTFVGDARFEGRRFSSVSGLTNVLVTGNRIPYTPQHLFTGAFGYSHAKGFDVQVEAVHVGEQFGDDLNLRPTSPVNPAVFASGQLGLLPAYTIWNAAANYRVERWRTTFFITVKNLTNRLYIADRVRGILPGPPRLVQAGFRLNL